MLNTRDARMIGRLLRCPSEEFFPADQQIGLGVDLPVWDNGELLRYDTVQITVKDLVHLIREQHDRWTEMADRLYRIRQVVEEETR